MKNRILIFVTMALLLGSCNEENLDFQSKDTENNSVENAIEKLSEDYFICGTLKLPTNDSISSRVSSKGKYWERGQTVRIKFLNGEQNIQDLVIGFANEWMQYANVRFEWVGINDYADIRIKFIYNNIKGGNSYVGTDSKIISQSDPSMNYFNLEKYNLANKRRVVLHEFGHALGLEHEHLNPTVNISWNYQKVYEHYERIHWTKAMVDFNIFNKLDRDAVDYGYFDPQSIMNYSIPKEFTTNGFSIPVNYDLSIVDKSSIGIMYPFSRPNKDRIELHRYWNDIVGDHFYTNNWNELGEGRANYVYEATLGYLEEGPASDNVPLYRYYSSVTNDHFYTNTWVPLGDAKHGYIFEGLIGYIKANEVPGSKGIYRYFNPDLGDHFYTTNYDQLGQGKWGWNYEGIVGYIMQQ